MVLFMLMILNVVVSILSNFLHIYIPFNQTLVSIFKSFLPIKWYVKEPIFSIHNNYHYNGLQKKSNNTIVFIRIFINGNVNVICYVQMMFFRTCYDLFNRNISLYSHIYMYQLNNMII